MARDPYARPVSQAMFVRIGPGAYRRDLVAVGSELVQIDRNIPQLERDEPTRAATVKAALALVEAKLVKTFAIDPQLARAAALRHAGVTR